MASVLLFCGCSRKTLIYLILTLNHIYPDYDFSQLRAHHFRKELGLPSAEELVDTHLIEVSKVHSMSCTASIHVHTMKPAAAAQQLSLSLLLVYVMSALPQQLLYCATRCIGHVMCNRVRQLNL